jgi:hypothetical protein
MSNPYLPNEEFVDNLRRALVFGQVNVNLLASGAGANLQGASAYPASEFFIANFKRALATGTITTGQIANPNLIENLGTYAPADSAFVLECNRAGAFGQLTSLLETDSRLVTFSVNMNVETFLGDFNPATMGVEVRGDFNGYTAGSTLTDANSDGIYTATFDIVGAPNTNQEYKYYTTGVGAVGFESGANRSYLLNPYGVNQVLTTGFFSYVNEARKWTVSVDLSEQVTFGKFVNDGSYEAYIVGPFSGWVSDPAWQLTYTGSNSIYQATFEYEGANPSPITYKFFTVGTLAQGYEGGSDRSVTLGASLTTTTTPTAVYVNVNS